MICVWMAGRDAQLLHNKKTVDHLTNALIHICVASVIGIFYEWYHFFGILLMARIVFDTSLNVFRHFNPFYVSPSPSSFVDKVEKKIFGSNGWLPKLIYFIILLFIWSL